MLLPSLGVLFHFSETNHEAFVISKQRSEKKEGTVKKRLQGNFVVYYGVKHNTVKLKQ